MAPSLTAQAKRIDALWTTPEASDAERIRKTGSLPAQA
jgi:hypothetical protein